MRNLMKGRRDDHSLLPKTPVSVHGPLFCFRLKRVMVFFFRNLSVRLKEQKACVQIQTQKTTEQQDIQRQQRE